MRVSRSIRELASSRRAAASRLASIVPTAIDLDQQLVSGQVLGGELEALVPGTSTAPLLGAFDFRLRRAMAGLWREERQAERPVGIGEIGSQIAM